MQVGFDIYGSGIDPSAWVEVYVDSIKCTDWTLTSPSGPLNTIARPITNAVITPGIAWSGVIDIIAVERPFRTVQLQDGRPIDPRTFNFAVTQLTARQREAYDRFARTIKMPFGDAGYDFPFAGNRAGTVFGFDADGRPALLTAQQNITQAVRYDVLQNLTSAQQQKALTNVGIGLRVAGESLPFIRSADLYSDYANPPKIHLFPDRVFVGAAADSWGNFAFNPSKMSWLTQFGIDAGTPSGTNWMERDTTLSVISAHSGPQYSAPHEHRTGRLQTFRRGACLEPRSAEYSLALLTRV